MTTNRHTRGDRKWFRGIFLLVLIPLLVLAMCLSAVGIQEQVAADRVEAELARVRHAGYPTGNESLNAWFFGNTSRGASQQWNEILRLVVVVPGSWEMVAELPFVGDGVISPNLPSAGEWPEERQVAEHLRLMQPVIGQIEQVAAQPAAVWQPIQFDGVGTLLVELQDSRSVVRLLQLEAEHAMYLRDAERALRALQGMRGTADAFDWPFCLVCELVQISTLTTHHSMIRRSLEADMWDEQQLLQLADQVGPARDARQRWQQVTAGERALMLASLQDPDILQEGRVPAKLMKWLLALPTVRDGVLESYRQMELAAGGGLDDLRARAAHLERIWQAEPRGSIRLTSLATNIYHLARPSLTSIASAMAREETSRRFTHTALAVKRFQLQEGHWPEDLNQLVRLGLQPADWSAVGGNPFGFEAKEQRAYLWSHDLAGHELSNKGRVALTEESADERRLVVMIR